MTKTRRFHVFLKRLIVINILLLITVAGAIGLWFKLDIKNQFIHVITMENRLQAWAMHLEMLEAELTEVEQQGLQMLAKQTEEAEQQWGVIQEKAEAVNQTLDARAKEVAKIDAFSDDYVQALGLGAQVGTYLAAALSDWELRQDATSSIKHLKQASASLRRYATKGEALGVSKNRWNSWLIEMDQVMAQLEALPSKSVLSEAIMQAWEAVTHDERLANIASQEAEAEQEALLAEALTTTDATDTAPARWWDSLVNFKQTDWQSMRSLNHWITIDKKPRLWVEQDSFILRQEWHTHVMRLLMRLENGDNFHPYTEAEDPISWRLSALKMQMPMNQSLNAFSAQWSKWKADMKQLEEAHIDFGTLMDFHFKTVVAEVKVAKIEMTEQDK